MTVTKLARLGGVSSARVRLLCKQGRFPGAVLVDSPIGEYWLIPEAAAEAWLKDEKRRRFRAKEDLEQ